MNKSLPAMPSPTSSDALPPGAVGARAVASECLTPYEMAAKAIFVKANGLAAYYKTTRAARFSE
jgi:hypothetical protein